MSQETAPVAQDKKTIHLLYIGTRVNSKNKPVHKWFKVDGIDNDGSTLDQYDDKRIAIYGGTNISKRATIGQIWSIVEQGKGTVLPSTAKYVELWDNKQNVQEWFADDLVARATLQELKRSVKDKTSFEKSLDALEPLRRAYGRASRVGRAAILQRVMAHIMRG